MTEHKFNWDFLNLFQANIKLYGENNSFYQDNEYIARTYKYKNGEPSRIEE